MKILLTSIAHCVAPSLLDRLLGLGYRVSVLIPSSQIDYYSNHRRIYLKEKLDIVLGNITSQRVMDNLTKNVDVIFHFNCADQFPDNPLHTKDFIDQSICGTQTVLESIEKNHPTKLVYVSTGEVYGDAKIIPTPETEKTIPLSPHLAVSIATEELIRGYQSVNLIDSSIIRLFNPYGPNQSSEAIIPTIIQQALNNKNILLGNMNSVRDFIHIEDVISALLKLIDKDNFGGQTINIGSGEGVAIGDLAEKILGIVRKDSDVLFDATRVRTESHDIQKLVSNSEKANHFLEWKPKVSLVDGLTSTVEWYSNWSIRK